MKKIATLVTIVVLTIHSGMLHAVVDESPLNSGRGIKTDAIVKQINKQAIMISMLMGRTPDRSLMIPAIGDQPDLTNAIIDTLYICVDQLQYEINLIRMPSIEDIEGAEKRDNLKILEHVYSSLTQIYWRLKPRDLEVSDHQILANEMFLTPESSIDTDKVLWQVTRMVNQLQHWRIEPKMVYAKTEALLNDLKEICVQTISSECEPELSDHKFGINPVDVFKLKLNTNSYLQRSKSHTEGVLRTWDLTANHNITPTDVLILTQFNRRLLAKQNGYEINGRGRADFSTVGRKYPYHVYTLSLQVNELVRRITALTR